MQYNIFYKSNARQHNICQKYSPDNPILKLRVPRFQQKTHVKKPLYLDQTNKNRLYLILAKEVITFSFAAEHPCNNCQALLTSLLTLHVKVSSSQANYNMQINYHLIKSHQSDPKCACTKLHIKFYLNQKIVPINFFFYKKTIR